MKCIVSAVPLISTIKTLLITLIGHGSISLFSITPPLPDLFDSRSRYHLFSVKFCGEVFFFCDYLNLYYYNQRRDRVIPPYGINIIFGGIQYGHSKLCPYGIL